MTDWLGQALELKEKGEIAKAIDLLEQAVAVGDESAPICKELARLSFLIREVRAFANWCHEAMRIDGSDPEPHLMIARVLVTDGRWEEAIEALTAAGKTGHVTPEQAEEVDQLTALSRQAWADHRRRNPGFSNL